MNSQMQKYIETAKQIEKDGLKFYKTALKKLKDPNSQGLLTFLVKEEEQHYDFFVKLSNKHEAKGKPIKLKSPLFKKADYKKVGSKKVQTIDIMNTALEMEEKGIKFYTKIAKSTNDRDLKKFLIDLAKMEQRHFKLIREHQAAVYDAWYWEAMEMPALNT